MKSARLELSPDRAFVLHLAVHARLPRQVVGRVEHVTSGQVAHVTCLGELLAFMAKVLRNQVRGERGTAHAILAQKPGQRGAFEENAAGALAQPTLRRRKRKAESP